MRVNDRRQFASQQRSVSLDTPVSLALLPVLASLLLLLLLLGL